MQPLHDKVFLKPIKKPETTSGGIVVTASEDNEPNLGIVTAVGEGYHTEKGIIPLTVRIGDKVSYSESKAVHEQEWDGEKLLIMSEKNILAIIDEE